MCVLLQLHLLHPLSPLCYFLLVRLSLFTTVILGRFIDTYDQPNTIWAQQSTKLFWGEKKRRSRGGEKGVTWEGEIHFARWEMSGGKKSARNF